MQPLTVRCCDTGLRFFFFFSLLCLLLGWPTAAAADETPRYISKGRVLDGAADWLTISHDHLAFGSAQQVTIATVQPVLRIESVWTLDVPATGGLLSGSNLYLVRETETSDELVVVDLDSIGGVLRSAGIDPAPRGTLKIAPAGDYLLLAESGSGLHILQLPTHHHAGAPHHGNPADGLTPVGFLPIEERILALSATLSTIYVATEEHLIEINASVPSVPTLVRRVPSLGHVRAMAANADTVYLLGDDGLRTVEFSQTGDAPIASLDSGVRGNSLLTLGRSIYVAGGDAGVQRYQDTAAAEALFVVAVGDIFFNPAGALNVNVNDMVEWQKQNTALPHNVRSCVAGQGGCPAIATQSFFSGGITTFPFIFNFTFTVPGNNPYVCQAHFISMQGDIVVSPAGPLPPPAVPHGGPFAPMTVSKLIPGGANLGVQFDTGCPDAINHNLIFGISGTLPTVLGGTYTPAGSQCTIGASPFLWNLTPAVPPGNFVWWVLVAEDGVSVEGSWGKDSNVAERNGVGLNGSSNLCGNVDKDLTNTCGQ
ncbi:MAG: hypothetical protein IH848_04720 [Acidobacteria bacterium]|nr:hypothetical protein [Acidobacteriota bacterium]